MTIITGDTHGKFEHIEYLVQDNKLTNEDIVVILGDVGLNFYLNNSDRNRKRYLSSMAPTFLCIHGNHEARPQTISTYKAKEFLGGEVLYEDLYPNLLFAIDGSIFDFPEGRALIVGGAYSVDKHHRLKNNLTWFPDEQPSISIKIMTEINLHSVRNKVDYILTHTCPFKYIPRETFLSYVDQSSVDNSTELWLDKIEESTIYKKWYCGHYHISKSIDRIIFMKNDARQLGR